MMFWSVRETLLLLAAAIVIDWCVGDPPRLPHPVVGIGKLIGLLERLLLRGSGSRTVTRLKGAVLALTVVAATALMMWGLCLLAYRIHPWAGFAVNAWFISTTIAVKGLKDAAMLVYEPLRQGDLAQARKMVGRIVGRDTDGLEEREVARAAVETVAENTVDAFVAPLFFALIGAAPLAMLYRAANTLDSMVGYKNEKYRDFGWASARLDDALNWIPARVTGALLALTAACSRNASGRRAWRAIRAFAHLHPSPNSGIPEAAVAGALGVELGGTNRYGGVVSERARLGWSLRPLEADDIVRTVRLMYGVSCWLAGGLLCVWLSLEL